MLNIGIYGADGRIGKSLVSQLNSAADLSLAYAIVEATSEKVGKDTGAAGVVYSSELPPQPPRPCEVFIDFSAPAATQECLAYCVARKIALVVGTTGHSAEQQDKIQQAAQYISIMQAANMSAAVNACFMLIEQAAKLLGCEYDVEILEKHHKHKLDAPSGTALAMAERVAAARDQNAADLMVHDRAALKSPRAAGAIGMQSVRGGEIIGEHEVMFINENEIVTISHQASSKEIFAAGAIRAARWLAGREPGLYAMADVLRQQ